MDQSATCRERTWKQLGTVEPFSLTQTPGGASVSLSEPRWPALRENFRVIRRPNGNVLLVSDGLSDPFDDFHDGGGNVNGFSLEFYVETPAEEIGSTVTEIRRSWQFQLLHTVGQLAAGHGSIRSIIDEMGLLSTEAEGVTDAVPAHARALLVNSAGRVGALLGLQDPRLGLGEGVPETVTGMPLTDVKLVNVKLISLAELRLITERGAAGRRKLAELFSAHPDTAVVSSLLRQSAV
ncbi:hypothetical protein H632_c4319p0 [Helicosporidium sp. ATCC 50920]|nr:hypothetical protein H632_c4319p0 [Helicosporidium sp. ATCC 50920]|eukprot:KDD71835.1 hypothetical protein H632_c4319p0 [Helicosporidium sp. ATCC 50920]